MIDSKQLLDMSTILANTATFLGIPFALYVFMRDKRHSREAKERETYQLLQSEYSNYLRLCLDNLDLPLHDFRPAIHGALTPEQEKRRMIAFEILVSMFESAYFLYSGDHSSAFKKRQWTGWDQYIKDWVDREDFRSAWQEQLGSQFDSQFINYINGLIQHQRVV